MLALRFSSTRRSAALRVEKPDEIGPAWDEALSADGIAPAGSHLTALRVTDGRVAGALAKPAISP